VAISLVFSLIYSPQNGLLNQLLQMFGIPGADWLGTSRWQMPAVIILQVWLTAGYNMVIYLAGLQGNLGVPLRVGGHRRRQRLAAVRQDHGADALADDLLF